LSVKRVVTFFHSKKKGNKTFYKQCKIQTGTTNTIETGRRNLLAVGTIFDWASTVSCDVSFAHYHFLCRPIVFCHEFYQLTTTDQRGEVFPIKHIGVGNKPKTLEGG